MIKGQNEEVTKQKARKKRMNNRIDAEINASETRNSTSRGKALQ